MFDDRPVGLVVELKYRAEAPKDPAVRIEVLDWDGKPVAAKATLDPWRAIETGVWIRHARVPLKPGTYRMRAVVKLACGELVLRVPAVMVVRADKSTPAYWGVQRGIAQQEGNLERELAALDMLERLDATDHGRHRAEAYRRAGRPGDAQRELAAFQARNPSISVEYLGEKTPRLHRIVGEIPPCGDSDYYLIEARLTARSEPDPVTNRWETRIAGGVEVSIGFTSQAPTKPSPRVRMLVQAKGEASRTLEPEVTWTSSPTSASPEMHRTTKPVQFTGVFKASLPPARYQANVEVTLPCGTKTFPLEFEVVP
ncbi:MAG: hypothetical protein QM765_32255 [Myxococcales bacterium]